jgi:hypothetical protein
MTEPTTRPAAELTAADLEQLIVRAVYRGGMKVMVVWLLIGLVVGMIIGVLSQAS